jgi:magnesium transporter
MAAAVAAAAGEASAAKKRGASRSWILFDASGEERVLDADKYAIMHRVDINARDLRILDPLLSYPSAILGRERAIVLNLEVRASSSTPPVPSFFFVPRGIS